MNRLVFTFLLAAAALAQPPQAPRNYPEPRPGDFTVPPDNVGHGSSSKPSDGMKMSFPRYDYDDMVALQHELLTQGLGVNHLRLVMGTSMGCMHSWVWAENYPDFMDAAMPLACLP